MGKSQSSTRRKPRPRADITAASSPFERCTSSPYSLSYTSASRSPLAVPSYLPRRYALSLIYLGRMERGTSIVPLRERQRKREGKNGAQNAHRRDAVTKEDDDGRFRWRSFNHSLPRAAISSCIASPLNIRGISTGTLKEISLQFIRVIYFS